jgi:uncharacterized protein
MIAVSNSTPLIALAKINQLNLLKDYFGEVYIPEEVYDEVVRRGGNLAGAPEVASSDWIKVEQVKNTVAVDVLCISLDRGEAEAIVLSKEKNALLIIDDGDGRRTAEHMGLKITGTIGILLLASQERNLDLKMAMDSLRVVGFRLGDREYDRILSLSGRMGR